MNFFPRSYQRIIDILVLGWSFCSVCHGLALTQNTGAKTLNVFFSFLVFPFYNNHDIISLKNIFFIFTFFLLDNILW